MLYWVVDVGLFGQPARFTTLKVYNQLGALEIPGSLMNKEAMISKWTVFIACYLPGRSISGIVKLNVVDYLHKPNRPI